MSEYEEFIAKKQFKITEAKAVKDYISSKNNGDIVKLYIMTEIE